MVYLEFSLNYTIFLCIPTLQKWPLRNICGYSTSHVSKLNFKRNFFPEFHLQVKINHFFITFFQKEKNEKESYSTAPRITKIF